MGTTGFFFLLFVAAFSLPKGYELKQKEVDEMLAKLETQFNLLWKRALQAIPKASDLDKKAMEKKAM